MKILIVLILLLLSGCKSVKYVPVETVKIEKEYIDKWKRDSVHVRDSVFVLVRVIQFSRTGGTPFTEGSTPGIQFTVKTRYVNLTRLK